jgi:hypothetical protein
MSGVWTDEKIREGFIDDGGQSAYYDPINGEKEQRRIAGAIFDEWLARHDAEVRAAIDWRVLGGLVPGVINASWLRDGDRVTIAAIEGVVIFHRVHQLEDVARFVVRTDRGAEVAFERWTGSEVRVIAAGGAA